MGRTAQRAESHRHMAAILLLMGLSLLTAAAPGEATSQVTPYGSSEAHVRNSPMERQLQERITWLGSDFDGDIGIAVKDVQTGFVAEFDGQTFFPQQSVSKFWVALTALNAAERGELDLAAPVTLRRSDLTLFHQPIARQITVAGHYDSTLGELLVRALQQSDNTCNDFVLRAAGGPEAVRAFLRSKRIDGIRFGPGERLMQSELAGLAWRPEYSIGRAFYSARSKVPLERRRAAFDEYVADPVDGARPVAVVEALARLKSGELLSPASTAKLLHIMSHTWTGPQRLKGGLTAGWSLAHKTGTGQQIGRMQTGYNDIGIINSPDGRSYAVAVMIRRTSAPIAARMAVMQEVVRAVIDYAEGQNPAVPGGAGITTARKR